MASRDAIRTRCGRRIEAAERGDDEPALVVDVNGFEGPLDLLLALARSQKVDITRISILALAEQYLAFIEHVRQLRLELAADYLVMAAWLAYLKSRLLLPETDDGRGADRRGTGGGSCLPAAAAGSHARRGGAARQPQSARPRRVRARQAGAGEVNAAQRIFGDALRPAVRLRGAAAGARDRRGAMSRRAGVVAARRARCADPHDRPDRRMDAARGDFSRPISATRGDAPQRHAPAPSAPASNWCARARSSCARPNPSHRSTSATARRSRPSTPEAGNG